jgi:hypothetical protein
VRHDRLVVLDHDRLAEQSQDGRDVYAYFNTTRTQSQP